VKRPLPAWRPPTTQLRWCASPGSGTIPLQIPDDRIYEPYGAAIAHRITPPHVAPPDLGA